MSRPGVEVSSQAEAPPVGVPTDTAVGFGLGEAQKGPIDQPTRITSLDQFTTIYGDRIPGTYSYDGLDAAFHEGASAVYFMRLAEAAQLASGDISAIFGAAGELKAASPGAWGNDLALEVVTAPQVLSESAEPEGESKSKRSRKSQERPRPAGLTFPEPTALDGPPVLATVKLKGKAVQTSRELATNQDLVEFLAAGPYLRAVTVNHEVAPSEGSATLDGGDDGVVPVGGSSVLPDALALIPKELGPGQVAAFGKTTDEDHAALLAHCAKTGRFALLDAGPAETVTELAAEAGVLRGAEEDRYGMLWAPWAVASGLAPGTTRTIPWSAIQMGICSRNDQAGNPNQAAAGPWGVSTFAQDLTTRYSAEEMETLLYAGVNTARRVYGSIEAYGFRTLVDPSGPRGEWREANHARLAMAIGAEADAIGEDYVFSQLDGRGHTIAAFCGALAGMLIGWYNADALYGDDPTEAFIVNGGPAVNTIEKLSAGILSAVLLVRMSPHAELVQIPIVKVNIAVPLAA